MLFRKEDERARLRQMLRGGSHQTRTLTRARVLLHAHEGTKDAASVTAVGASMSTVGRIRKQFAERGLDAALYEAPRPGGSRRWTEREKHTWLPLPVVIRHSVGVSGRCSCLRISWSRWG